MAATRKVMAKYSIGIDDGYGPDQIYTGKATITETRVQAIKLLRKHIGNTYNGEIALIYGANTDYYDDEAEPVEIISPVMGARDGVSGIVAYKYWSKRYGIRAISPVTGKFTVMAPGRRTSRAKL